MQAKSLAIEDKQRSIYSSTDFNQTLKVITSEPVQIIDEKSAKERIMQWISQGIHSKKVELATKAYKLFHRMSLIYIYDDLHTLAIKKYPNSERKQRKFERDFVCAQLDIHVRTERRKKNSAIRLQCLINIGITFEQLASVGLTVSHFESSNFYYDTFLIEVKQSMIKSLFQKSNPHFLSDTQEDANLTESSESDGSSDGGESDENSEGGESDESSEGGESNKSNER